MRDIDLDPVQSVTVESGDIIPAGTAGSAGETGPVGVAGSAGTQDHTRPAAAASFDDDDLEPTIVRGRE